MNSRSKSTLFLMEQLIVVAVFAICAAACVRILAASYFMATETREMSYAIQVAQSGAECYKAVSGDIGKTAEILGGRAVSEDGAYALVVYYDEDWNVCGESEAFYLLRLMSASPESGTNELLLSELTVNRHTGEEIIAFPVAVRGVEK